MAYFDPARGEAAEDLVTVLLAQQGHGNHEHAAELREQGGRGVDHQAPPDRQVLEVADFGEAFGGAAGARQLAADHLGSKSVLFGIRSISSRAVEVFPAPNAPLIQTITAAPPSSLAP